MKRIDHRSFKNLSSSVPWWKVQLKFIDFFIFKKYYHYYFLKKKIRLTHYLHDDLSGINPSRI